MTKNDYEIIVTALQPIVTDVVEKAKNPPNQPVNQQEVETVLRMVNDLATALKRNNSRFRYDLFFEALGLDAFGKIPGFNYID